MVASSQVAWWLYSVNKNLDPSCSPLKYSLELCGQHDYLLGQLQEEEEAKGIPLPFKDTSAYISLVKT